MSAPGKKTKQTKAGKAMIASPAATRACFESFHKLRVFAEPIDGMCALAALCCHFGEILSAADRMTAYNRLADITRLADDVVTAAHRHAKTKRQ
jgi:hypothetical protein